MELRHLKYFVAVAEELHFGRAAARLRIAQPALSRQVRQLEDEVGADLLDCDGRLLQLTAAGRDFLEGARETLALADRTLRRARRAWGDEAGRLSLAFVPAILESPEAVRILRTLPRAAPGGPGGGERAADGRAVGGAAPRPRAGGVPLPSAGRSARRVRAALAPGDRPRGAVGPSSFQRSRARVPGAGRPRALPLVRAGRGAGAARFLVRRLFESRGLTMHAVEQAASEEARLSLVAAGLGVTLVPGKSRASAPPGRRAAARAGDRFRRAGVRRARGATNVAGGRSVPRRNARRASGICPDASGIRTGT